MINLKKVVQDFADTTCHYDMADMLGLDLSDFYADMNLISELELFQNLLDAAGYTCTHEDGCFIIWE